MCRKSFLSLVFELLRIGQVGIDQVFAAADLRFCVIDEFFSLFLGEYCNDLWYH